MSKSTFRLGAVAYDPKVVTIWEGFKAWFEHHGLRFDFVLYSNYEAQVEAHFAGHFHVAWNSPLAWIEAERLAQARGRRAEAIAMRDTDCDLTSVVLVQSTSKLQKLRDLAGKKVAVGAHDSPQATLIPLLVLAESGLVPGQDFELEHHDQLVGKHGDHIGGERAAARALVAGKVDAACIIDGNELLFAKEGTLPANSVRVLARTAPYDHCNFTVLDGAPPDLVAQFRELLLDMRYDDPEVRPLLDLEGLKQWKPGRTSGYAQLALAVERFRYLDPWLTEQGAAPSARS
jgi:ABC-type phosphate/phosphonate transport system substrate-binding protein